MSCYVIFLTPPSLPLPLLLLLLLPCPLFPAAVQCGLYVIRPPRKGHFGCIHGNLCKFIQLNKTKETTTRQKNKIIIIIINYYANDNPTTHMGSKEFYTGTRNI